MKELKLTKGMVAIVDDDDYALVSKFNWTASENRNTHYAQRRCNVDGVKRTIKMHRLIMGVTDPKALVDHRNRNGLDNRRENLRIVSHGENQRNRRPWLNKIGSSKLGVFAQHKKFQVMLSYKGHKFNLGSYNTEDEAHAVYLKAIANLEQTIKEIISNLFPAV